MDMGVCMINRNIYHFVLAKKAKEQYNELGLIYILIGGIMNRIDSLTVNTIRTLVADAVERANSGHPGLAIGAAPMALAVFEQMKHRMLGEKAELNSLCALGRDRFVLSAGHASMLQYALMHLFGYDVSIDDIKHFRQLGSKTAGHPEYGNIVGIEATTGPLGQGFAMAVGMAMAEKHCAAMFNRDGYTVFDNYTYTLMGDGCMMEGVASEAASLAGTQKLNKLIALYDSNRITIEGSTDIAFTENVAMRFMSYGWNVLEVLDGEDIDGIRAAIASAKRSMDKPTLIIVHTKIAHGTPKEGLASSHGSPLGADNIAAWKKSINWEHEPFTVPDEVKAHMSAIIAENNIRNEHYSEMLEDYRDHYAETFEEIKKYLDGEFDVERCIIDNEKFTAFDSTKRATRQCSGIVLNHLVEYMPNLFGGSADLGPSNNSELKNKGYFSPNEPEGMNIHFGVREFAMACICNGIALYGCLRPFCATFAVFSDYLKPAVRLAAIMKLNVIYILTHDSIGVGEDGPTHQPIEQPDMFRAMPNTYAFRPADGRETVACYASAVKLKAPALMFLSRQSLPQLDETDVIAAMRGGYVVREYAENGIPDAIIMASGSETALALKAAEALNAEGIHIRVVSMPCMELFDEQSKEYRDSILPSDIKNRIAVEALGGISWYKYIGLDGELISMKRFGTSAPGNELFIHFGFTVDKLVDAVKRMVNKS